MLRKLLGIILGSIVGFMIIVTVLRTLKTNYPIPEGLSYHDKEGLINYMAALPYSVFLTIIGAHFIATYLASFITARIADTHRFYMGLTVAILFIIASISHSTALPHPMWMIITDAILVIVAGVLGSRVGAGQSISR